MFVGVCDVAVYGSKGHDVAGVERPAQEGPLAIDANLAHDLLGQLAREGVRLDQIREGGASAKVQELAVGSKHVHLALHQHALHPCQEVPLSLDLRVLPAAQALPHDLPKARVA